MTKAEQRKMLENGVMLFTSNGGIITQCKPKGKQRFEKKEQEPDMVEIDISALPPVLRAKFFPDEV